jgi:CRP-like cAMP-binding protein
MTETDIASLLPGTTRRFKAKTAIMYQGEAPRSGYYIKKGVVKAYTLQASGEEQVVAFFEAGDLFPMSWLFGKTETTMYYHESMEPCELISVTRGDVENILLKQATIKDKLLSKLISDQAAYFMRITALEQSRAVEKIIFTLYYLMYQFGKEVKPGKYLINIKLTHATIASLVGLTRETTATELNKLKRKNVLAYSRKLYTLDKLALEKMIGEDSFSDLIKK